MAKLTHYVRHSSQVLHQHEDHLSIIFYDCLRLLYNTVFHYKNPRILYKMDSIMKKNIVMCLLSVILLLLSLLLLLQTIKNDLL